MLAVYTSVVLKLYDFGSLWSYKGGGLPLEVSLYCKCIGACVNEKAYFDSAS